MTIRYLDASAWVKRYVEEAGTTNIQELFSASLPVACATLGFIEVCGVLARKQKAGAMSSRMLQSVLSQLQHDWRDFIRIGLTAEVVSLAGTLATTFGMRGADAVHLASAEVLRRRFESPEHEIVVFASDRELNIAAGTLGFAVFDPTQE